MKMRTAATLSVAALATGSTLIAAPTASAGPVYAEGEGWMPPGQICQQARTVSEDGSSFTIAGLPGMRCGQFLGKAALPEEDSETPVEEPIVEEPIVEEPVVEEPVTEEPVAEEPTDEEATEGEQLTVQSTQSGTDEDGWSSSHQARSNRAHNGQSHWAQKGNRHPHHPGNANGGR